MLFSAHKLMPQICPGICFDEPTCQRSRICSFISNAAAKRKSLWGFWHYWRWISLQISRRFSSPKNLHSLQISIRIWWELKDEDFHISQSATTRRYHIIALYLYIYQHFYFPEVNILHFIKALWDFVCVLCTFTLCLFVFLIMSFYPTGIDC